MYTCESLFTTPRPIDKHLLDSCVCTLLVFKKNSVINTDGYVRERLVLGSSLEGVGGPRGGLKKLKVYFMSPAQAL